MVLGICVREFSFIYEFRDEIERDLSISVHEWQGKFVICWIMTTLLHNYIYTCKLKYVANSFLVIVLIHPRKEDKKTIINCYYYFIVKYQKVIMVGS